MTATQTKTLSPVFWEAMIKMPPARLAKTLFAGLKRDPVWMTDQALCAAQNVELVSEEYGILTEFCHAHYSEISQKNLSLGIKAAVTGLDAVGDDPDELGKACDDILTIFRQMAVFNSKRANDEACANKARLGDAHPLYGALTEFLLEQLDDDDYDMFKHISHSAAQLSPESRAAFVDRLERMQDTHGYGVGYILENICMACAETLHDDPAVKKAATLLRGDTPAPTPPPKKKPGYEKSGNVITLHPRRDP